MGLRREMEGEMNMKLMVLSWKDSEVDLQDFNPTNKRQKRRFLYSASNSSHEQY